MCNNELIAIFMGFKTKKKFLRRIKPTKYIINKNEFLVEELLFNISWDWLINPIEKIENLGYRVMIANTECIISAIWDNNQGDVWEYNQTKIEATYEAIVKFIKIYNDRIKK